MKPRFYVQSNVVMVYEDNGKTVSCHLITHDKEIQPTQVDTEVRRIWRDSDPSAHRV